MGRQMPAELEKPGTRGEMLRLEERLDRDIARAVHLVLAIATLVVGAAAGAYWDLKRDLSDQIDEVEIRMAMQMNFVRSEMVERINDQRERDGLPRIEYDALPMVRRAE